MISAKFIVFFLTTISFQFAFANSSPTWNGKRAAVVLTYDDSLHVHLDTVIPALNKYKLNATFYLSINPAGFSERIEDWRQAASQGHELGNHTLFHPCDSRYPGRDWVLPEYDLAQYSLTRFLDEVTLTNKILNSVDGKKERTFAYTCGDTKVGNTSFVEALKPLFVGARGVANNFSTLENLDLYNINAYGIHQQSGTELIDQAKIALDQGSLLVYLFHGVGGEHSIDVSVKAHNTLLKFLHKRQQDIWVTTMVDAANYVKSKQKEIQKNIVVK